MYVQRYAYYSDLGWDGDRCLGLERPSSIDAREAAFAEFSHVRVASSSARSAIFAAAAARRCIQGYACSEDPARTAADLPVFVACGTGLSFTACFVSGLANACSSDSSLESRLFFQDGPRPADILRHATMMLAGLIAQLTGLRGENRSLTGFGAGLIALRQADRFLRRGRAPDALVVCGESLVEWDRASAGAAQPLPREFGCAFLVTRAPGSSVARFECGSQAQGSCGFTHLEALNAPANLCWALDQQSGRSWQFEERDRNSVRWSYGVTPNVDGYAACSA